MEILDYAIDYFDRIVDFIPTFDTKVNRVHLKVQLAFSTEARGQCPQVALLPPSPGCATSLVTDVKDSNLLSILITKWENIFSSCFIDNKVRVFKSED